MTEKFGKRVMKCKSLQYATKQADAVATIGGEVERKEILLCYYKLQFIKLVERI